MVESTKNQDCHSSGERVDYDHQTKASYNDSIAALWGFKYHDSEDQPVRKPKSRKFLSGDVLTNIVLMLSPKQVIDYKLLATSTNMRAAVFEA